MPEPQRSRTFARAERKFDLMGELGCDLMMVCSNVAPDSLGGIDRAAADFHDLGERAAKRGLRVGFEALAWGRHISDYRDAWEVVRRADHPAIGLTSTASTSSSRKTDLKAIRSIPSDKIVLVQLADAPWLDMDVINWSRHFRCFPGQGDFPLLDFMDAVPRPATTAVSRSKSSTISFAPARRAASRVDGQRSLIYLMDQMRDRPGALAKAAPQIPPRARCLGVEFLEFAADEPRRGRTGQAVRRAGLPQGRRAQLEGGDALVAGRDQPRAQHRARRALPTPIALARALGLRDRASRSTTRPRRSTAPRSSATRRSARRSGRASWKSRRCAGSAAASLFRRSEKRARPAVGHRLHRAARAGRQRRRRPDRDRPMSQSMHYEEMLSWLLFYNSLLDVTKTPQLDVIDPGGIVRSQVVQTADGSAPHRAQRLAEPADAVVALPDALCRLRRAAHRFRHRRHRRDASSSSAPTASSCCRSRRTTTTISRRAPISPPSGIDLLRGNNILYDRDEAGEYLAGLHPQLRGSVLLRDRRAPAATKASAPSTRRSGWRRRRDCRAARAPCAWRDRARQDDPVAVARPLFACKAFGPTRAISVL